MYLCDFSIHGYKVFQISASECKQNTDIHIEWSFAYRLISLFPLGLKFLS